MEAGNDLIPRDASTSCPWQSKVSGIPKLSDSIYKLRVIRPLETLPPLKKKHQQTKTHKNRRNLPMKCVGFLILYSLMHYRKTSSRGAYGHDPF